MGAVQLACGSPVPVVLHVDPGSPASAGGSTSRDVGLGVVPFVCTSTSEVARVRVLVENFGAAVTLSGTGSAGVWVVPIVAGMGTRAHDVEVGGRVPVGIPAGR